MKQHVALPACVTQMYFIYFRSCYWVLRLNFFWLQFASEDDGEERGRIFFFYYFFLFYFLKPFPGSFSYLWVPSAKSFGLPNPSLLCFSPDDGSGWVRMVSDDDFWEL